MGSSVDHMCREMGEGLLALMGSFPDATTRAAAHGWLALSGMPLPDFNYALLDSAADATLLRDFGATVVDRGVPAIIFLASAVADALGPVAADLGLQHVGSSPLMVYQRQDERAVHKDDRYRVERVEREATLRETTPLLASAFSLPLEAVDRLYSSALLARPDVNVFIARHNDEPVCSVTTTGAGEISGIWCMATPPQHQRKGAGRATLDWVIRHHLDRGTDQFYLGATEAGKKLYDDLGFETVDELAIWLSGQSTQFPAH